jgi:hypothetical protein
MTEIVGKFTASYSSKRLLSTVLLGWLVSIAIDFFQNAGLFAKLWLESAPAFLPPEKLFQRIPLGYIAFLMLTILLTWLMVKLNLSGWKQGTSFGLKFGVIFEAASILGTMSAFPVSPSLLAAWFFGGVVKDSIVCTVIGSGLGSTHFGRLWAKAVVFIVVIVVVTLILQALGYAPAT